LHWAASSDDVDVTEVLIDGGADLETPGSSIAGTPLGNAVGYGCWHVARLLVARGARVDGLWQAAVLGMLAHVEEFLAGSPPPTRVFESRAALHTREVAGSKPAAPMTMDQLQIGVFSDTYCICIVP